MDKGALIAQGKSKRVYATNDPTLAVVEFMDEAVAYQGFKRQVIRNKGEMNNRICTRMFTLLRQKGIDTPFVQTLGARQMLVTRLDMLPISIVTRNIAAGDLCQRTGLPAGERLKCTVVECRLKSEELQNPLLNHTHIAAMGLATRDEMDCVRDLAVKINGILASYLKSVGIELIDIKLEFGRRHNGGELMLGDEITPQNCRLWDVNTHETLDLDLFRRDLGDPGQGYQEIMSRILGSDGQAAEDAKA